MAGKVILFLILLAVSPLADAGVPMSGKDDW